MNFKSLAMTVGLLVAALSLTSTLPAQAVEKSTEKSTKVPTKTAPTPAAQPQAAAPPVNQITQAVAQAGVSKCLGRINQISNFLTANTQSGAMLFTAPAEADRRLASVSLEVQAPNALSYAGATFAPGAGANECSGMYEAVTYWNNTCNDVGSKAFGTFKRANPLRQVIASLEGGPTVRVFLIPAGQGCISIKKEMVYQ